MGWTPWKAMEARRDTLRMNLWNDELFWCARNSSYTSCWHMWIMIFCTFSSHRWFTSFDFLPHFIKPILITTTTTTCPSSTSTKLWLTWLGMKATTLNSGIQWLQGHCNISRTAYFSQITHQSDRWQDPSPASKFLQNSHVPPNKGSITPSS